MHAAGVFDGPQPVLVDEVVRLRPPVAADIDAVVRACQDPDTLRYTTVPSPYARADAQRFVDEYAPAHWRERRGACWALTPSGSDQFCGSFDLRVLAGDPEQADIGYQCAPWARGRGLTTAAVGLAVHWGFAVLGLARISWRAYVGNVASRRVVEKNGFVFEGTERQSMVHRGERMDCWVAALLPSDLADVAVPGH